MNFSAQSRRRSNRRSTMIVFDVARIVDQMGKNLDVGTKKLLMVDLSADGARFETGHLIPENAILSGVFLLPMDAKPVECSGIVLRINKPFSRTGLAFSLAIQFTQISDEARARIARYVESGSFII